jgi:predicted AlkP superfamily phosphohydrolase/phosphomutase
MTSRVLAIGLDGADSALLADYCARGVTPVLAGLCAGRTPGQLIKQTGLGDDPLWSSFATASPIEVHGRYHGPNQYVRDRGLHVYFSERPMRTETFWSRLSARGKSVAVLDVPKCPLATELNGFQLADWLVHGRDHAKPVSAPAGLADDVIERFGTAPASPCNGYVFESSVPFHQGFDAETAGRALASLLQSLAMKRAASAHYLGARPWDLFMTVFKELHCAGHLMWDLVDSEHAEFDAARNERFDRPLETLYRQVDAAIGALVDAAGPDCRVVVFSPHGMRANITATDVLGEFLRRKNSEWTRPAKRWADRAHFAAARIARRKASHGQVYDYGRSLFFPLNYNEYAGAVRINLKGRERSGTVDPDDLPTLRARLSDEFRALRYQRTGQAVVAQVLDFPRGRANAQDDDLPDLLIVWANQHDLGPIVQSDGRSLPRNGRRLRPGGHDEAGFYLLGGGGRECLKMDDIPIEKLGFLIETMV